MPLRSDPGRLPRRNHYQEGPGFLFVATQGGRPPEADVAAGASRAWSGVARRGTAALGGGRAGRRRSPRSCGIGRATLFRWRSASRRAAWRASSMRRGRAGRASSTRSSSG